MSIVMQDSCGRRTGSAADLLQALRNETLEFAGLPERYPRSGCEHCVPSLCVSDPIADGLYPVPEVLVAAEECLLICEDGSEPVRWSGYTDGISSVPVYMDKPLFAVCVLEGASAFFENGGIRLEGAKSAVRIARESLIAFSAVVRAALKTCNEKGLAGSQRKWEAELMRMRTAYTDPNIKHFMRIANESIGADVSDLTDDDPIGSYFNPVSVCADHQLASLSETKNFDADFWRLRQMLRWSRQLNIGYLDQHRCRQHGTPFLFANLCAKIESSHNSEQTAETARKTWNEESSLSARLRISEQKSGIFEDQCHN